MLKCPIIGFSSITESQVLACSGSKLFILQSSGSHTSLSIDLASMVQSEKSQLKPLALCVASTPSFPSRCAVAFDNKTYITFTLHQDGSIDPDHHTGTTFRKASGLAIAGDTLYIAERAGALYLIPLDGSPASKPVMGRVASLTYVDVHDGTVVVTDREGMVIVVPAARPFAIQDIWVGHHDYASSAVITEQGGVSVGQDGIRVWQRGQAEAVTALECGPLHYICRTGIPDWETGPEQWAAAGRQVASVRVWSEDPAQATQLVLPAAPLPAEWDEISWGERGLRGVSALGAGFGGIVAATLGSDLFLIRGDAVTPIELADGVLDVVPSSLLEGLYVLLDHRTKRKMNYKPAK